MAAPGYRAGEREGVRGWRTQPRNRPGSRCLRSSPCAARAGLMGLWARGPSRRLGDRRGGSVCAARVRVRVGPPRHARLRPPWGGVSRTGYRDPCGPADVTLALLGRRMRAEIEGQRFPLPPHPTPGTLSPSRRKTRASQAHVQSERHSGLTLEARGAEPGGVNPVTVRVAGPSVDTIPIHVAFAWGPDLTTPAVA